ncbi:MAG: DJ-1/PfpI family protein [Vicinamibacterales bacterium]
MNRRDFSKLAAAAALGAVVPSPSEAGAQQAAGAATHEQDMATAMKRHEKMLGGPHLTIAMLPYPGMFLQDLVGPLTMFEALLNRDVHLVWKNKEPITVGTGMNLTPTMTFAECPDNLDVLFVPGGVPGTFAMMEDAEVLRFLAAKGKTARYVTSVCTGSLILGAAGLLKGYKATSYWNTREVLTEFGAIPTEGRIVVDRNRITGGGVTAGLDFGLAVVAALRSRAYAEAVQLYVEYDPHPPFNAGSPRTAPKEPKQFIDDMFGSLVDVARQTAIRAQKRLG